MFDQINNEVQREAAERNERPGDEGVRQLDEMKDEYEVELSALSDEARQDVHDALDDAAAAGQLDEIDVQQLADAAERSEEHRENAETLAGEQREAIEEGDYEAAHDRAARAEHELHEASAVKEAEGWFRPDAEEAFDVLVAEQETVDLDAAEWHQEISEENAQAADSYLQDGEFEVAQLYADEALESAEVADAYADDGYNDEHDQYDDPTD